jgi:hypothetical protein
MEAAWLDAEGDARAVVCQVGADCCLRMSPSAYWLYANLHDGRTPAEIAKLAELTFGSPVDAAELAKACAEIVARVDQETRLAVERRRRRYLFRVRLLPETAVSWLASRLDRVFCRAGLFGYVGLIAAAVVAQVISAAPRQLASVNAGGGLLAAYLIYLIALAAHEFGHATACSRYGVKPGSIGFAVYLAFPALYCDVTRAWLLSRRHRVVVDVSGVIFEIGGGAVFAVIGGFAHQVAFTLAAFFVLGNLVWALNPFGRFDMYWALADALGGTNLRTEGWRVLRGLLGREHAGHDEPAVRRWRRTVVAGYVLCGGLMISGFCYYALGIDASLVSRLPLLIHTIGGEMLNGRIDAAISTALEPLTMLTLLGVMLYRAGAVVVRAAMKRRGCGPLVADRGRGRIP